MMNDEAPRRLLFFSFDGGRVLGGGGSLAPDLVLFFCLFLPFPLNPLTLNP